MTATTALPRTSPEAQGISSTALLAFLEKADTTIRDLHSFMLLRRGSVVAEGWWHPYGPEYIHLLFSLSKSFTSTAAGFAVAEGRLALDDTVLSFFPEDAPAEVSANLAAMRVHDLLTMSTGHAEDTVGFLRSGTDGNWARAFLARPVEHSPGTHFLYNSGATYMVSAILQKLTGMRLLDYLRPRLLDPIGITPNATWETCPRGIDVGGWGLSLRTEDIARFGQFYLQKGIWEGHQLLAESWIDLATRKQVPNGDNQESDWNQGYGFQFWRCRNGAYRGDGAFGQFCIVLPEQEAVVAITAGTNDLQLVLNLIWDHLLPAFGSSLAIPTNNHLRERLDSLALPAPRGDSNSSLAGSMSGSTYVFEANDRQIESVAFEFGETNTLNIKQKGKDSLIPLGTNEDWIRGSASFNSPDMLPRPVAASMAWQNDHTLAVRLCYYETPFCPTLLFRFEEDSLVFDLSGSLALWGAPWTPLNGRLLDVT